MSEYVWQCPFCNQEQSISKEGVQTSFADLTVENADGPRRLVVTYVVCQIPSCRKFSLNVALHELKVSGPRSYTGKNLKAWSLIPPSRARVFPIALPQRVLEDYQEACLTLELSPKIASALSRRCLSEILRDFWQVQPGTLSDEFRQIKGTADPLTWEAIESVRKRGMVGTRMETEGAEIQDTDPGEARLLLGLIETLIQDWYVGREERRKRLAEIRQITSDDTTTKAEDQTTTL